VSGNYDLNLFFWVALVRCRTALYWVDFCECSGRRYIIIVVSDHWSPLKRDTRKDWWNHLKGFLVIKVIVNDQKLS